MIERRWAERRFDRLPALATELVQLKVDFILVREGLAIQAAKQATSTIPIVMFSSLERSSKASSPASLIRTRTSRR